jgi:hypothetical protein
MHGVIAQVKLDPTRREDAVKLLNEFTVPTSKGLTGFVSGSWLRGPDGDHGVSVLLFETEEAARAGAERIRQGPPPGAPVTLESAEVYEVLAQA